MAAAIDLDIELRDAHTLDSFPGPRSHCLIGGKLFHLAGCGIGPESQIAHPCPGFLLLASGGAMPRQDSYYEHYRTNQHSSFHKFISCISTHIQQWAQSPRSNFLLRPFATELLLYYTANLQKPTKSARSRSPPGNHNHLLHKRLKPACFNCSRTLEQV